MRSLSRCGVSFVQVSLGAFLSLVADLATAEIANDNDLYAAYCIGSLTESNEQNKIRVQGWRNDPVLWGAMNEAESAIKLMLLRFTAYMTARGYPRAHDLKANVEVVLSTQRGRSDQLQCDEIIVGCVASCSQRDANARIECTERCRDQRDQNAACNSVARCTRPDNLPF